MRCPYCYQDNDRVGDTRTSVDGFVVRRRRVCCACGRKFTTYERVESPRILVRKRDGSLTPFDRDSLQQGLERACWKRQISDEQIAAVIAQIERDIDASFESEVESRFIGERVMHYLHELDQVAYVRFASVYRDFKDADDFVKELQRMEQNPGMPCRSSEFLPKKKTMPEKSELEKELRLASSEFLPKKKTTQFPKTKRSRYKEQEPGLLLEDE